MLYYRTQEFSEEEWEKMKNEGVEALDIPTTTIYKVYYKKRCMLCFKWVVSDTFSKTCKRCRYKMLNNVPAKQRKEFIEKNKYCYFCSSTDTLCVHHIDLDTTNNKEDNLLLLCTKCHNKLHHKIYSKFNKIFSTKYENINIQEEGN